MSATALDRTEVLRRRHVDAKRAAVPEQLARLRWSSDRLDTERQRRLRELIRGARLHSRWHAARLAEVDADRLQESDLPSLPAMTKADVMEHFDQIVTDPRLNLELVDAHLGRLSERPEYLLDRYQAVCSSGSTGTRGISIYNWDAWVTCYLGWFRYLLRDLGEGPFTAALVAAGKAFHISRALIQTFADLDSIAITPIPVILPQREIVARLNQIQPDVLLTYPSELRLLAEQAVQGRLRIVPRAIATAGEPLLPETREAAETAFSVPVLNWWLCSEAGPLAIGCGHGPGLHLSDDLLIVEPVDSDGRRVPPGERSAKIYVTNLYNPVLPLIRYEITDEVTPLFDLCPCGSAHRLVADIHGRLDDAFRYPSGVAVHAHVFRAALCHPDIIEYQVRQTPRGAHLSLRAGTIDIDALRRTLTQGLRTAGLDDPELDIDIVDEIPRQGTGKLKRFTPLA